MCDGSATGVVRNGDSRLLRGRVYYLHWAALMCIMATCWENMLWGSLCISSVVLLNHPLYLRVEHTWCTNTQLYQRWERLKQFCSIYDQTLKHPQGTWAFDRIHRAETKPGIAGLRKDLSGYLRRWPIARKDNSMYKNISRDLPVHITVFAILASRDLGSRKAMACSV